MFRATMPIAHAEVPHQLDAVLCRCDGELDAARREIEAVRRAGEAKFRFGRLVLVLGDGLVLVRTPVSQPRLFKPPELCPKTKKKLQKAADTKQQRARWGSMAVDCWHGPLGRGTTWPCSTADGSSTENCPSCRSKSLARRHRSPSYAGLPPAIPELSRPAPNRTRAKQICPSPIPPTKPWNEIDIRR